MDIIIPRTCTLITKDNQQQTFPLSQYRDSPAYVLLGEPGMGKTKAFEQEAEEPGCEYVEAWDLFTFDDRPEWHNKTLFIDGLDEVRAGRGNVKGPFHAIRNQLEKLGRPRFRLSCREADWLGSSDMEQLQKVAPDNNEIQELHLDELTEDNINEILSEKYSDEVDDTAAFIEETKKRDLFDLIKNPQILDMLVSAVKDNGEWPNSRHETFKLACRRILIIEHNKEHSDTQPPLIQAIDKQLDAAGYLCALLLLSDKPGLSLTVVSGAENKYPYIHDLGYEDHALLRMVTKTKLFNTNNRRTTYVHRTVAEYLAAVYLKKQVEEKGLPVGRVLALLTGEDGVAVAGSRGLFAWFVTLSERERSMLIERDPLGLILYGDVSSFSVTDKRKIIDALRNEAERYVFFRSSNWTEYPFGALCTEDMEPVFREILTSPDRSDEQQAIVDCVLDAMKHGEPLQGLSNCVLKIIHDPGWWSGIRRQALHVFIRLIDDEPDKNDQLMKLLKEIKNNKISDHDDNLFGVLLDKLYPEIINPSQIFDFLHSPKQSHHFGFYQRFWSVQLEISSSDEQIAQLLDELASRHEVLKSVLSEITFRPMIGRLLLRGLKSHGEAINPERLYSWLSIGIDKHNFSLLDNQDEVNRIKNWIGSHHEYQKAIIELQLENCATHENFIWCVHEMMERLYHADLPADYGLWCLTKAKKIKTDIISKYLTEEATRCWWQRRGGAGLSIELLEETIEESPRLAPWIRDNLVWPADRGMGEYNEKRRERKLKGEKEKFEYIQTITSNINEIRLGRANPGVLHNLGMAYYGLFIDFKGDTPYERLSNYFENESLVESILTGFKNSLTREDIPEIKDIFQINLNNRISTLSHPFRAGLEELCKENSRNILQLTEDKLRKALAFYFADGYNDEPDWYLKLVRERTDLVAEIFVDYSLTAIRRKKEHISGIYSLAFDESHKDIARLVTIPLLSGFPARCNNKQLEYLDYLLKAACQYAESGQLLELVEKKLKLHSMNIAQYTHWLATAFILSPKDYSQSLLDYFGDNIQRIKYLAGFFAYRGDQLSLTNNLPDFALALLIRLLGLHYPPHSWNSAEGHVTADMHNADLINSMINKLSTITSDPATEMIDELIKNEKLSQWRRVLQGALYQQRANKREVNFSHPGIEQVSKTLQDLAPANVADLAALTLDHIRDLATKIRDSDTDDYKQYWNQDSHNRPVKRKHEEACRDTFLSDLKHQLAPLGIDAEPESHVADDKEVDIKVSYGGAAGFNVPIEIKCNDHKDLWYAIHNQLIKKYTRDPGAHGYGIYLVFWFGKEVTPPPPEGSLPKTAVELEERLSGLLSNNEEKRLISVCVIDCANTWSVGPSRRSDRIG